MSSSSRKTSGSNITNKRSGNENDDAVAAAEYAITTARSSQQTLPRAMVASIDTGEVGPSAFPYSQMTMADGSLGPLADSMKLTEISTSKFTVTDHVAMLGDYEFCFATLEIPNVPTKERYRVIAQRMKDAGSALAWVELIKMGRLGAFFHHPNIATIYGVCTTIPLVTVFHETAAHGPLDRYLKSFPRDAPTLLQYALDVCKAMVYLQKYGFVHWDIAARNVVLHGRACKLANLGLCKAASDNSGNGLYRTPTGQTVLRWSAPEVGVLEGTERKREPEEDAWCFGFFLYELYSQGKLPYNKQSWVTEAMYLDTMYEVQEGALLPQPDRCPDHVYGVMVSCWDMQPIGRPVFQQIHSMLLSPLAVVELDAVIRDATEKLDINQSSSQPAEKGSNSKPLSQNAPISTPAATPAATAPGSPRAGRKFPHIKDANASIRGKSRVNDKVVQRFSAIFSEPGGSPDE